MNRIVGNIYRKLCAGLFTAALLFVLPGCWAAPSQPDPSADCMPFVKTYMEAITAGR